MWISLLESTACVSLYYQLIHPVCAPRMRSLRQGCSQQRWVGAWEGTFTLFSAVLFPLTHGKPLSPKCASCLLPFKKSCSVTPIYPFKRKFIPNSVTHSSGPSPHWHYTSERLPVSRCLGSSFFTPVLREAKLSALRFQLPAPAHESHWKLLWVCIKIAHENILKSSSSSAKCQQEGNGHQRESGATLQMIQSVS